MIVVPSIRQALGVVYGMKKGRGHAVWGVPRMNVRRLTAATAVALLAVAVGGPDVGNGCDRHSRAEICQRQ